MVEATSTPTKQKVWLSRLLPYWLTVLAVCWILTFIYLWSTPKAADAIYEYSMKVFTVVKDKQVLDWSSSFLGFICPLLIASSFSTLLLTNISLPSWRFAWLNKIVAHIRKFPVIPTEDNRINIIKKNQFGIGELDFNFIAIWTVLLPSLLLFSCYIKNSLANARNPEWLPVGKTVLQQSIEYVSYLAGWVGVVLLSFFLIPVSRHSVLLVAMNWSPIHALRIHVWAGYLSFFYIFLHGILLVGVWFKFTEGPIYKEFIPPKECWTTEFDAESRCHTQFYNFTGMIAFSFFLVLLLSSLNWFRRKWYRVFYIIHVSFGTLMLLASVWHYEFIGIYLFPSLLYYLASTMPTLIQALASRFRGGVKITKVIVIDATCLEVHVTTDPATQRFLIDRHPSKYIKLCVPKISLVWHPFTVYNNPADPTTVRFLFRAIGPFTKQLRERLLDQVDRPVTLIDGFYKGGDHCKSALYNHDHVTIVAGGVAITPFISMINAILNSIANNETDSYEQSFTLRSMTLIWSCRESELLSFVKRNYLDRMAEYASTLNNFDLKIKIFYTGKQSMFTNLLCSEDSDSTLDVSAGISDNIDIEKPTAIESDGTVDGETEATMNEDNGVMDTNIVKNLPPITYNPARVSHPMELARMMPARNAYIEQNIPYFVAFTGSVWLGFHILFYSYDWETMTYADFSEQCWMTILGIIFFILVAITIEGTVLYFGKYWLSPHMDDFVIASSTTDKNKVVTKKHVEFDVIVFDVIYRRVGPEDVLSDAKETGAPGIFMCGPDPLLEIVYSETRKENSRFGLTRYALYKEAFDM